MAQPLAGAGAEVLRLRLYVAGVAPNSLRAAANAKAMCAAHFPGCELEIVDLLVQPERAAANRIIVTPTLVKLSPLPEQRLIGDLSDAGKLLTVLGGSQE
jgi:circadian clock protein KaiB